MNDFINKYNEANGFSPPQFDPDIPLGPFIGHPKNLSLPQRQELVYRFQFLEESVPTLASAYRLTPIALQEWLDENEVAIQRLETEEDIAQFETQVNAAYKDTRIRMTGLVALHSAVAWESLQRSSEDLLASLELAAKRVRSNAQDGFVDVKELKGLIDAHAKVIDKHALIKQAIDVPADRDMNNVVEGLQKTLEDLLDEIDGSSYKLPSQQ